MSRIVTAFEQFLWKSRLLIVVAVLASVVAALAVLFVATVDVVTLLGHAGHYAFPSLSAEARHALHDNIITQVVEVVDGYLLSAVLIIFALGLYELFIKDLDLARSPNQPRRLLVIENLDDLKGRLARVILLILIVNLFQDALRIKLVSGLDLVYQAAAIALIGLALYLSHRGDSGR
jgi:uncharacterized membrane protein YqhA